MSKASLDTLIEVSPGETRAARMDQDGLLHELLLDRVGQASLVGGIYAGRIVRIEKGMDAAFVDIGLGEPALMNKAKGLAEGKNLIVQVSRDGRDGKGPAVTRNLSLLDRYLAYTPGRKGLNWARAVGKGRDRARLEDLVGELLDGREGYSVRGPAVVAEGKNLIATIERLEQRWEAMQEQFRADKTPRCLEAPISLIDRLLRDADAEARFAIDDRVQFMRIEKMVAQDMPDLAEGLLFHKGPEQIFDVAGVEEQIDEAVSRTVSLRGGGSMSFDHTEAMTVIDVNMGAGTKQGDDAIFQVNRRAAETVARQIILRNIAGLIVVDFISMRDKARAKKLVEILRARFRDDARHTDVLGLTAGGLIEITRQREGITLAQQLTEVRPEEVRVHPVAQACAILRLAIRMKGAGKPTAMASGPVMEALNGPLSAGMEEATRRLGQPIILEEGQDSTPPVVEMR